MFLLDSLLLAPGKAVLFMLEELAKKAQEEFLDDDSVKQELQEIYARLEGGSISEQEFETRELGLMQRLEQIMRAKFEDSWGTPNMGLQRAFFQGPSQEDQDVLVADAVREAEVLSAVSQDVPVGAGFSRPALNTAEITPCTDAIDAGTQAPALLLDLINARADHLRQGDGGPPKRHAEAEAPALLQHLIGARAEAPALLQDLIGARADAPALLQDLIGARAEAPALLQDFINARAEGPVLPVGPPSDVARGLPPSREASADPRSLGGGFEPPRSLAAPAPPVAWAAPAPPVAWAAPASPVASAAPAPPVAPAALTMVQVIESTMRHLSMLKLKVSAVTAVSRADDGWRVTAELLERKAVPDTSDLLGVYDLQLDAAGNVLRYERTHMRRRSDLGR